MSDVEIYWNAIAGKMGDRRAWSDLSHNEQIAVVQSINLLLAVLHNGQNNL